MKRILLIEDDLTYSKIIKNFLERNQYAVQSIQKVSEALHAIEKNTPHLIITDYRLPDGTGMEILEKIIDSQLAVPVILITNYSDIRTAVKTMKMGAFEYITKPVNPDELLATVKEAFKQKNKKKAPTEAPSSPKTQLAHGDHYVAGTTEASRKLEEYIDLVAPTDMSVIVLGESGTGKEYISKRIHQKSSRKDGPFVAIDCGALSKELAASELFGHMKGAFTGAFDHKVGNFESAKGGTIFLDEIGNLSYDVQIKLLRAIQERKIRKVGGNSDIDIDVRIIVATNEDLIEASRRGEFREDLYHRLNEFSIQAIPLRDRGEELFDFANNFLEESNNYLNKSVTGFSSEVKEIFKTYSWPGNLRELKNIVKRAVLLTGKGLVEKEVLPIQLLLPENSTQETGAAKDLKSSFEEKEKSLIIQTLEEVKFNKSKAAKILNMDRKTLYNKIEKYNISS
ncbi:sigma-54-dependent Fis family transcriptional regulator [Litoribacter ruber]|uniref:Sigma-54-dependent Fis family transcriptional regulator n=1 Tax=Litoribacter ruber TaxID=702568 RepID=A0AAP2CJ75_9BACT|nr:MULTISPECIES: sigma-54 dependent transcriptional regulator [Litoribacter]MBS9524890.1 sigma-54-dependent Fis family transcriptional regulator [Litoribacter alkaliphilus]MBT0811949.1 sigma-54-dependent Fis family transcriptional regulator [Litoribacter ruber]